MPHWTDAERLERAIQAACEVAARLGWICDRPIVLQNLSNVVLQLAPAPVVARLATTTGSLRLGEAWLKRELAIAQYLVDRGAPVIPPSPLLAPGPHAHPEFTVSFWQWVEVIAEPIDPQAAGKALRLCHQVLAPYPDPLPVLGLVAEVPHLISQLLTQIAPGDGLSFQEWEWIDRAVQQCYQRLLPVPSQAIHGDPHFGNVLMTRAGVVWTDWEDAFWGPIEWDLASLVASAQVFGRDLDRAEAALRGYGWNYDPEILDRCIEARTLVTLVWNWIFYHQSQDFGHRDRAIARLHWLKRRLGG